MQLQYLSKASSAVSKALGLVFAIALGACSLASSAPQHGATPGWHDPTSSTTLDRIYDLQEKTIAFVGQDPEGRFVPFCGGVWVGENRILTAWHCMTAHGTPPSPLFPYATFRDVFGASSALTGEPPKQLLHPTLRTASLLDFDAGHDLALLRAFSVPAHRVAPLAVASPGVGQEVEAMGHPRSLWWSYSRGEVSALRYLRLSEGLTPFDVMMVQTTCPVSGGSSGAGLFDTRGNLVGITHGLIEGGENLNFFIHMIYGEILLQGVHAQD